MPASWHVTCAVFHMALCALCFAWFSPNNSKRASALRLQKVMNTNGNTNGIQCMINHFSDTACCMTYTFLEAKNHVNGRYRAAP